ncbi:MAG: FimB/Mfa2 family fimbrial subunit [Prevotella sp.]|nr:FimB/Mfa2 family fimbrial subunit [Prevotella sp.]
MEKVLKCAFLCMSSLALGACEKEIISDDITTDNSVSITTRSANAEETVSFPIVVYAFDQESKGCVDYKMLPDKETPLVFNLPYGTYAFYAIGGIDDERYSLPAEDHLTEKSEIVLKEGMEHADLMTAQQTLKLQKNDDKELTLHMERQVIELTSVTLSQIPDNITSVNISLTPCYKSITIDGALGTLWEHKYSLTNEGEGVWSLSTPTMLLLSPESPIITISMEDDNNMVKEYSYQCTDELKKNHQIRINATYQENNTMKITGQILGDTWSGSNDIIFNFGEDNINIVNAEDIINEETPAKGSAYNGCYVMDVIPQDHYNEVLVVYKEVLLLADYNIIPTEEESKVIDKITEVLSNLSVNNILGWRLPNENEAKMIISNRDALAPYNINIDLNNFYYLKDSSLKAFNKNGLLNNTSYTKGKYMLPIITLKFKK